MHMSKPTEVHQNLARFAGTWTGEEVLHPSQWDPNGSTVQARNETRLALGGFVVIGDYEQQKDGQVTFTGHSVHTYDANLKCHVLYWFDCMGVPPNVFTGNFAGDALILTCEHTSPGGPRFSRLTYDMSKPGKMQSRMEMSDDGETWVSFMDGSYTRQGG